uniref:Uncharacterized protein n=1 Tax=Timema genevievae TaxID=629358 RepID=A0A7R9JQR8_TIMGE|nr:unnamed protein product [Timema genevievae]
MSLAIKNTVVGYFMNSPRMRWFRKNSDSPRLLSLSPLRYTEAGLGGGGGAVDVQDPGCYIQAPAGHGGGDHVDDHLGHRSTLAIEGEGKPQDCSMREGVTQPDHVTIVLAVKIGLGCNEVDWIELAQDRDRV